MKRIASWSSQQHQKSLIEHSEWEWYFAQVLQFVQQHGHDDLGNHPAAEWLRMQCQFAETGRLSIPRRKRMLEAQINLPPARKGRPHLERLWVKRFKELTDYQQLHGHTNVTKSQNKILAHWRDVQREFRQKGKLSAERITKLDEIGFEWESSGRSGMSKDEWHQHLWEEKLERLEAFRKRFGHSHVPVLWEEDRKLGTWVAEQRNQNHKGKLPPERFRRLDELEFVWDPPARFFQPPFPAERKPNQKYLNLWEERFAEMAAFQKQHGHTNVTDSQNRVLAHWKDVQREFRRKGKLSAERIARLDGIGFSWGYPYQTGMSRTDWNEQVWMEKLERLRAFIQRFGHTQVPHKWSEDQALGTWVAEQRKAQHHGTLASAREQKLTELGFEWWPKARPIRQNKTPRKPSPIREALWEQRYAELVKFHHAHGHCLVPNKRPEIAELCKWCYSQRHSRRHGTLRADRVVRLDELGFRWDATEVPGLSYAECLEQKWEEQFSRLIGFKREYGDCQVPARWVGDKGLAQWVDKQRQKARAGQLSAEKRQRLDAVGFVWHPKPNGTGLKQRTAKKGDS